MSMQQAAAQLRSWLVQPFSSEVAQSIERLCHADDVRHVAVMPDVHLANEVCVGVAMATQRLIYPAAVGSDIGCGMAAIGIETKQVTCHESGVARAALFSAQKCTFYCAGTWARLEVVPWSGPEGSTSRKTRTMHPTTKVASSCYSCRTDTYVR